MKVHFTCSTANLEEYKKEYLAICDTIKDLGHSITHDWINEAINRVKKGKKKVADWQEIYIDITKSVLAADVAIFENTVSSFATGYQLSLALERRKPVLMLYAKRGKRGPKDRFAAGIETDLITSKEYTLNTLKEILSDFFLQSAKGGQKIRFNFFIDKKMENYLDWAAFTYKKKKADILRGMINDQMLRGDSRYRKYLESLS